MTDPYGTKSLEKQRAALNLPFADGFAHALVALLTARKISLHEVASLMPGEQNAEANRQQLRRGLDHGVLSPEVWTNALAALLPATPWILALDRTEWKRGDTTINILVLAVVLQGCTVPLLWAVLPRCGNSDTAERIALLERFLTHFEVSQIRPLTLA